MSIYFKIFETPTTAGDQKIFVKQAGEATTKIVAFKGFDFNCSVVGQVLDLGINREGVVNSYFVNYSTDINKEFMTIV